MTQRERHRTLLAALQQRGSLDLYEIGDLLCVSEATVRRDLAALEGSGRLIRVRGGAESLSVGCIPSVIQPEFQRQLDHETEEKQRIAARAARSVRKGDSIVLGSGTLPYLMARQLEDHQLRVLTNSLAVAETLIGSSCDVHITGGRIFAEQRVVVSSSDDPVVSHFAASTMFVEAHGINTRGVTQPSPMDARGQKQMLASAERVTVLAEPAAFSRRGSYRLCSLEQVDTLVTGESTPRDLLDKLAAHELHIVVARTASRTRHGNASVAREASAGSA